MGRNFDHLSHIPKKRPVVKSLQTRSNFYDRKVADSFILAEELKSSSMIKKAIRRNKVSLKR